MSQAIHVTSHAIDRYIERVETCSREDAIDRLTHAVQISEPASRHMIHANSRRRGKKPPAHDAAWYRFCPIESLLLILRVAGRQLHLVTVFKLN